MGAGVRVALARRAKRTIYALLSDGRRPNTIGLGLTGPGSPRPPGPVVAICAHATNAMACNPVALITALTYAGRDRGRRRLMIARFAIARSAFRSP